MNAPRKHMIFIAALLTFGLLVGASDAQTLTPNAAGVPGIWGGSTTWGDIDGDGDPDLVITGLTGPQDQCQPVARIYRNTNGQLTDANAGLTGVYLGEATLGDYDGDGDLDLALSGLTAEGEGVTLVYRNDNGQFVQDLDQDLVPLHYSAITWGDYDSDGDTDLLVAGANASGSPRTVLYRNARIDRNRTGSPIGGRPTLEEDVTNTVRITNVSQGNLAWGDVDNDGDLDLAVSGYGAGNVRQTQIFRNDPLGSLIRDERNNDLEPVSGGDLAFADIDNDGDLDLMLSGWNAQWEATLERYANAAGIFGKDATFSATRIIGSLDFGDYDNDGDLDLAAAGQNSISDRYTFILRNNDGALQSSQTLSGLRGGDLAWADIDSDGDLDLLATGEDDAGTRTTVLFSSAGVVTTNTPPQPPSRLGTPFVTSDGVTLNWNDGIDAQSKSNGLTYILSIGTSPGTHNVFSGTVPLGPGNMGNRKTVQLSIPLARDTYYWSLRTIDGGFLVSAPSQEERFSVQDLVSSVHVLRQLQNSALAFGDYDNDGDLDMVLSGRDADGIARSLLYDNKANVLTENSHIGLQGVQDGDLAWGDYDNDGDLDLLLTGNDQSGNRYTHFYRNRLDTGDFALNIANVNNVPQLGNSAAAWGDYDNDGDLDLALMGNGVGVRIAGIYRNDDGLFAEDTAQTLTPMDNGDLAFGDYDNDGDLDLATTGQINQANQAELSLYQNDNGVLTPDARSTLTGLLASGLAWGDYDNDGDLDLGITGISITEGYLTRIYANSGNGLLADAGIALTGAAGSDLAWGDYDNDGDLDLALIGQAANGTPILKVLRNSGSDFEQVPIDLLVGAAFATVAWADYDSDGDLDLASTGQTFIDANTFPPITRINDNLEARFNPNRAPDRLTGLQTLTQDATVNLSWTAGTDLSVTPDRALTYGLRVGTTAGGHEILSGTRIPGPGAIRNASYHLTDLTSGRYFWAVRAIDNGFAASAWSAEESFIIDTVRPVIDSVQVRPRVLREGGRATVLVAFSDAPAGMDNAVSPQVTLQLPGSNEALSVSQVSYNGSTWLGELNIDISTPGGTVIVEVQGARDLKRNEMLPYQKVFPARVLPGSGGVVESSDNIVRLTIFPNALPTDLADQPDVQILSRSVEGAPAGATPVSEAYEITVQPSFALRDPATLAMQIPQTLVSAPLAIYQLSNSTWSRLGGTVEEGEMRVAINDFGTYALFQDSGQGGNAQGVTNIDFSNRAFSPGVPTAQLGSGAAARLAGALLSQTDISFELGQAATVRIEIYSRTGRLERILETGRALGPGRHIITWDGRDHENRVVKSGLYIVVIDADGNKAQKTLAVVNN